MQSSVDVAVAGEKLRIPHVTQATIRSALDEFDRVLRGTQKWEDWETKKSQLYAISDQGKLYPPKQILSMATGVPVSRFSGGEQTNAYLENLSDGIQPARRLLRVSRAAGEGPLMIKRAVSSLLEGKNISFKFDGSVDDFLDIVDAELALSQKNADERISVERIGLKVSRKSIDENMFRREIESLFKSPPTWEVENWFPRLQRYLSTTRGASAVQLRDKAFLKELFDSDHVSATGMCTIRSAPAIENEDFVAWFSNKASQPLPADSQEAAARLVELHDEIAVKFRELCGKRPFLKINRALCALFPDYFTTLADEGKLTELYRALGGNRRMHVIHMHIAIRKMVEDILGPAAPGTLDSVKQMCLPWLLYRQISDDRRIVALATGELPERENIDSIQVHVQVPSATVDTPANRAICVLLKRFQQALVALQAWVMKDRGELSEADAFGRCNRRLEILRAYNVDVRRLLNCYPFRGVKKPETTAAGLTQVAANPTYARAYRTGTEALRLGVDRDFAMEHLHVSPSWGVYETWCYVALADAFESWLGIEFKPAKSKFAETSPDLVLSAQLPDGRDLELLFQTTFRSDGLGGTKQAWSLSRERRPDIVLVVSYGDEHRTFVLDAKYRSGKSNVLDAMASAHIYHDSLFLAGRRPDLCLLLLPGEPEVESLEKYETWETYGVGTVSGYSVGAEGVQRCVAAISTCFLRTRG